MLEKIPGEGLLIVESHFQSDFQNAPFRLCQQFTGAIHTNQTQEIIKTALCLIQQHLVELFYRYAEMPGHIACLQVGGIVAIHIIGNRIAQPAFLNLRT